MNRCTKCGSQMTLKNDELICIFCPGKVQGKAKPGYVPVADPGDAGLRKVMKGKVTQDTLTPKTSSPVAVATGSAEDALRIMKSLPMPDDVKEFKQIKRIIASIEKLIEVQK